MIQHPETIAAHPAVESLVDERATGGGLFAGLTYPWYNHEVGGTWVAGRTMEEMERQLATTTKISPPLYERLVWGT